MRIPLRRIGAVEKNEATVSTALPPELAAPIEARGGWIEGGGRSSARSSSVSRRGR